MRINNTILDLMNVPFVSFDKTNAEIKSQVLEDFTSFFDSKQYILGNRVKEFEKEFADFCEVDYGIGVGNGLDALKISLLALNIGIGDEVIVPSNTYIATLLAISHTGAKPVFVEPDIETYNIDPKRIKEQITKYTKAIIPVHLYGQPCAMDQIMSIAKQYNLYVIEDNAQAQGALFRGKSTGSFGVLNATSFYPTKNLGAIGDAGMITTNKEELMNRCQLLRNYGSIQKNYHQEIGYNSRLDELQAGVLKIKLSYLEQWNKERVKIASWYNELLKGIEGIRLPVVLDGAMPVFHLFVIRIENRNQLREYLKSNGVETMIHYPIPPHLQNAYQELGYRKGDFPIAEELADTSLSLPLFIGITKKEIEYVSHLILSFFGIQI